jgi:pimeloyl-ACP methyl ester carboxylesterase
MAHPAQQIRFCTSRDGTSVAYATYGTGPPLVWARHHTLVRYDLRGCGLSDRKGVEFTFGKLVEDLEAVIEAAGVERFAFFGMTGCARIAVSYLLRHPDMVSQLVLYGASARGPLARNPLANNLRRRERDSRRLNWAGRRKPRATVNSLHRCTYRMRMPSNPARITICFV